MPCGELAPLEAQRQRVGDVAREVQLAPARVVATERQRRSPERHLPQRSPVDRRVDGVAERPRRAIADRRELGRIGSGPGSRIAW